MQLDGGQAIEPDVVAVAAGTVAAAVVAAVPVLNVGHSVVRRDRGRE